MPKFRVDVKAFFSVEVKAENAEDAMTMADAFVESVMVADANTITGWQSSLENPIGTVLPQEIGAAVDDGSDVEEITDRREDDNGSE